MMTQRSYTQVRQPVGLVYHLKTINAPVEKPSFLSEDYADPDDIRTMFSCAMSDMYRAEVPLYGELLALVQEVNERALARNPELRASLEQRSELDRLNLERHGAIRVGTAQELQTLSRMFAIMGMSPVGYYDLSTSGVPVHATAFRPTRQASLDKNPFRIFTSLLRPNLLSDSSTRDLAIRTLGKRSIFTRACLEFLEKAARQDGRLSTKDAPVFVKEAIETFRWHSQSPISRKEYDTLSKASKLAADVCGFQSCHINHLTPRTLDIEAVQRGMAARGITPKAVIEGPPPTHPILLRQTSFLALSEPVEFLDPATGEHVLGHHQARFGEIEQRSLALTREGRELYAEILADAKSKQSERLSSSPSHSNILSINDENEQHLATFFSKAFPATYEEIRKRDLGYFRYKLALRGLNVSQPGDGDCEVKLETLIQDGTVTFEPLIYEDFLPASAAGIFQSNLGKNTSIGAAGPDQAGFEVALGQQVIDEMFLYASSQQESLDEVAKQLGLPYRLFA